MRPRLEIAAYRLIGLCLLICLDQLTGPTALAKEQPLPRVAANNTVSLRKHVGKQLTVYGKVQKGSVSDSGHHFLNFYSSNLSVVCFKDDVGKFDGGGPAKLWANQEIEISGKLELYRGKPQIKLLTPDQIKLPGDAKTNSGEKEKFSLSDIRVDAGSSENETKAAPFQLKSIGQSTWMSPAGLIYRGKDPEGLTRVEHVLRHASDQPKRAGPHGVFDGDEDQALATVDEAWKLVKKKKVKPKKEGDRLAYTVPMGRRVGYLGGQVGARRNNPPLKKVFIVIRGTSEVITAFPR